MQELKPCPLCGSHDVKVIHDCHVCDGEEYASVKCRGCGTYVMALGKGCTPDEAENDASVKWNRRADECDRDAMRKLADGLDESFGWLEPDANGLVTVPARTVKSVADRIRKAMGEEIDVDERSNRVFNKLVEKAKSAFDKMCMENVHGNYRAGLAESYKVIAYIEAAKMLRSEFQDGDGDDAPVA